jgi:hypothetical protein
LAQSVAELVPRVQRAIEGPVPLAQPLPEESLKAIVADAISDIIFYTNGAWEHTLTVTERDNTTNHPTDWEVDPALEIQEETVVAAQAALNYFFFQFKDLKVQETIQDEGQQWSYQLSANVLQNSMQNLRDARDRALEILMQSNTDYTGFVSYIAERDAWTSSIIEPWLTNPGGGQELFTDYRFGG